DDRGRRLAAGLWPTLQRLPADGGGVAYHLDGAPAAPADARHPVGLIGAAAAASVAGDRNASAHLLDEAATLDRQAPTYYGAAWLALGETMPPLAEAMPPLAETGRPAAQASVGEPGAVLRPIGRVRLIAASP